jgi:NAD(P)-dependent dehydrogenase (short-subunit alcohol dehydrogenase family)
MSKSANTVVITGATSGIGLGLAKAFLKEGYNVVGTGRSAERLQSAATQLNAGERFLGVAGDIGKPESAKKTFEQAIAKYGKVDVLVNNAGVLRAVPIPNMTEDIYREVIDVNQVAVFLGMKAVVGPMVAAGGGSIVNISSIDGHQGTPTLVAYVAAKYAGCGMTRVAALELAQLGIRANTVCPGATRTRMMDAPDMAGVDIEAMSARMAPLGRIGEAHEVAAAALFLASDESSYITGTDIVVDGGATSGVGVEMFSQVST